MRFSILLTVLIAMSAPAFAYRAGSATPTKFGAGQQAADQNNYRTFSNYNDRVHTQGVQTNTVQTQMAGSATKDLAAEKKRASKKAAAPAVAPQPPQTKPATALQQQPAAATSAGAAGVNPSDIIQQVQGMVNSVGSMSGALQQGQAGQNAAAMPDLSALMGGAAMPANQAVPAKK